MLLPYCFLGFGCLGLAFSLLTLEIISSLPPPPVLHFLALSTLEVNRGDRNFQPFSAWCFEASWAGSGSAVRRGCRSSPAATWPSSEPWPPSPSARRKSFHGKTLEMRARFGVAGLPPLTLAKRQRELERARVNIDAPGSVIHPSILPSIQPTCDLSICPSTISI